MPLLSANCWNQVTEIDNGVVPLIAIRQGVLAGGLVLSLGVSKIWTPDGRMSHAAQHSQRSTSEDQVAGKQRYKKASVIRNASGA